MVELVGSVYGRARSGQFISRQRIFLVTQRLITHEQLAVQQSERAHTLRYMLIFFADEDAWMALSDEEREAGIARIGAWYTEQARAGRIVEGCRLRGREEAVTIRLGPAGRSATPEVTSGPFSPTPESIGSYAILEVANADEAIAVASAWPGGGAVEVRPLLEE